MLKVRVQQTNIRTGEVTESWEDFDDEAHAENDRLLRGEESRAERGHRLTACDWTQVADVPLSDEQREQWRAYRQALRDVTDQPGFPDAIVWPESP